MSVSGRVLIAVGVVGCFGGIALAFAAIPILTAGSNSSHEISPIDPRPVLVPWTEGQTTVDARDRRAWTHFDFSRGSVVTDAVAGGYNWDLAFQRYRVATNSGATNPLGLAGAIKIDAEAPAPPKSAPADGYVQDEWDQGIAHNRAFRRWYRYSPLANGLISRGYYYLVRTADRGYAWLQFVSYHCPSSLGGGPGCVTFRYGYRSDFSRELRPP